MSTQDKATLKSYFEDDDKPNENQFGDFIDTLFDGLIWHSTLVVPIRGIILVDPNTPKNSLTFQVDISKSSSWASFVVQADSSVSSTGWEYWNGTSLVALDLTGLAPTYQNEDYGLVTYTFTSTVNTPLKLDGTDVCMRGDIYYIRWRSGFNYIWSDYQVNKVVLG